MNLGVALCDVAVRRCRMKYSLVLIAVAMVLALQAQSLSAGYSNIASCHLISLNAEKSVRDEQFWRDYTNGVLEVLRNGSGQSPGEQAAGALIERQNAALANLPDAQMSAFKNSAACRILVSLKSDIATFADRSKLDERFLPFASDLQALATVALTDLEDTLSRIRVKNSSDLTLVKSGYYCFVGSLVHVASSAEYRQHTPIELFGETINCGTLDKDE